MGADTRPQQGRLVLSKDLIWPIAIVIALAVVMVVNAIFIYIAVTGADEVESSYVEGER